MSDLGKHGLRWRMRGWPITDDYGDVIGYMDEPEWRWGDLTDDQQAEIRQEAVRSQGGGREISWDLALSFVLGHYAIACPHRWEYTEPISRMCRMCYAMEPLPGRVVSIAGKHVRVPDPPPLVWRVPKPRSALDLLSAGPDADPSFDVDEYRWTGSRYVAATGSEAEMRGSTEPCDVQGDPEIISPLYRLVEP